MSLNHSRISANVIFLCHDGNGNFLLSKRGNSASDFHGLWDPGSGKIEFGEHSWVAMKRELQEEYGVEPLESRLLGVRENITDRTHMITFEYLVEVDKYKVKNNEPHKSSELRWFKLSELPINKAHPFLSLLISDNHEILKSKTF